jgi:hypothetical protein
VEVTILLITELQDMQVEEVTVIVYLDKTDFLEEQTTAVEVEVVHIVQNHKVAAPAAQE